MSKSLPPLIEINLATLLISTAAVLAKMIQLPAPYLIWVRCILAMAFLGILSLAFKQSLKINLRKHKIFFLISGLLMAGHWVTYFLAIQTSTVAIAVIALFTFPVITALLEPLMFKTPLEKINLLFSAIVFAGVFLLVPEFDLENDLTQGLLYGLTSSLLYSFRNLLSKTYSSIYSGFTIMFYQLLVAIVSLIPLGLLYYQPMQGNDLYYLLFLGLFTTAFGHGLFVRSLKYYSASTVSIIASLQPVYAIIWAYFLLNEQLSLREMMGGSVILGIVVLQNVLKFKTSG